MCTAQTKQICLINLFEVKLRRKREVVYSQSQHTAHGHCNLNPKFAVIQYNDTTIKIPFPIKVNLHLIADATTIYQFYIT